MKLTERTAHFDNALGVTIRTVRHQQSFSQERLAQAVGVTFQQIQKYEKGGNRIATGTLVLIAEALGVDPIELLRTAIEHWETGGGRAAA